jgi:hypothetical protein
VFLFQLYASHVLACNRILCSVFGDQSGRVVRNFRACTCNLGIRGIRSDSTGRCLLYVERFVFNRGFDAMCEVTEESSDVRDSEMVLRS